MIDIVSRWLTTKIVNKSHAKSRPGGGGFRYLSMVLGKRVP